MTTTLGMVGNESSKVGLISILGHIYCMSNHIQCIGRLRKPQRGSHAMAITIVPKLHPNVLKCRLEKDESNFDVPTKNGMLNVDEKKMCNTVFGFMGLYNHLNDQKNTRRLVSLQELLGCVVRKCNRCDLCNNCPIVIASRISKQKTTIANGNMESASRVLTRLTSECLVCNRKNGCDGENCSVILGCHRCGQLGHNSRQCHHSKEIKQVLQNKGCHGCFGKGCFMKKDDKNKCIFARRLRHLICITHTKKKETMLALCNS